LNSLKTGADMKEYFYFINLETDELITSTGQKFNISSSDVGVCYKWDETDELKISIKDKTITNIYLNETVKILNRYN
jgi:hypothetical protein